MNIQTLTPGVLQPQLTTFNCRRRILVVGSEYLLEQGVTQLLTIRQDLEVFHTHDLNPKILAQQVEQIHPEVVILCHIDHALQNSLIALLACFPVLAELRIIIVNMQHTDLTIHQHNGWFSANLSDFFPLVYGENKEHAKITVL